MLVLCSRSARPPKGLARRAQKTQAWESLREGKTSELEGASYKGWWSFAAHNRGSTKLLCEEIEEQTCAISYAVIA
jgi:hypothetical protein